MARIAAHDVHHAAAANDLALITNTLNAGFDFHRSTRLGPKRTRADEPPLWKGGKRLNIRPLRRVVQGLNFQSFRTAGSVVNPRVPQGLKGDSGNHHPSDVTGLAAESASAKSQGRLASSSGEGAAVSSVRDVLQMLDQNVNARLALDVATLDLQRPDRAA